MTIYVYICKSTLSERTPKLSKLQIYTHTQIYTYSQIHTYSQI